MLISRHESEAVRDIAVAVLVAFTLGACGGGDGREPGAIEAPPIQAPSAVDTTPNGTISVAFSGTPAGEEFTRALMVINEIGLLATDPDEEDVVIPVAPLTVDLLQLVSFSEILFHLEVPINTRYYSIQLGVESLTLVRHDGSVESVRIRDGYTPVPVGGVIGASLRDRSGTGTIPSFRVPDFNPTHRLFANFEFPLELTLHRAGDGTFHLSPLALLSLPFETLFRIMGSVAEVIEPNARHPQGAIAVCDLQKASAVEWILQNDEACVFVQATGATMFLNESAEPVSGGIEELLVGDPVVVYGWWGIYVEERGIDPIQAMLIARGAGFERVGGPVSQWRTPDAEVTLGGAGSACASPVSVEYVSVGAETLIFRRRGERTVSVERDDIVICVEAEVEGVRIAPDELQAFVMVLSPRQFRGRLTAGDDGSLDRVILSVPGEEPACVVVRDDTELTLFFHEIMGPAYFDAGIEDLIGHQVTVIGLRGSDGCIDAERIAFVD
jgi:hypothetical protein